MKNLILSLFCSFVLAGCASEPITVLRTSHGEVISEQTVSKTKSSGLATVGGAAIGGLLGNQVGGGRGKTVATVAGAVAGGAAGHQVSKTEELHYQYVVHMDDGEKFILETKTKRQPIGAKVVVENLSNGRERINVLP
ncbi:glycine zipper 2TM domain-containing protein [Agarivorans sp. B2Z047]|uniref:glycine zipper 2TM domain-containing protein n=1 Tax=Agarivorans sp. B2Z047 TaxID=2652721 RepID=UPI00128B67FD|nr:glycine zipper 2TM domain-containing protein [Agarivorans sp. B2Z047]MPW29858.1 glycine zipper 2TM domain-containing protein [Agarivorans sp. B2Z047]UQN43426.1 glycine zipper 2TM domain-containing protein [Agarivorans sp. B2Z047]